MTQRGRGWMLPLGVVAMVALPIVEIWTLVQVGQQLGFWLTLALILLMTGIGSWLISREGRRAWQALNEAIRQGTDPGPELTDGVLILVGGLLLVIPGFWTDLIGLLFLFPFTRALPRRWLRARTRTMTSRARHGASTTIITGETVDEAPEPDEDPDHHGSTTHVVIEGEIEPPR